MVPLSPSPLDPFARPIAVAERPPRAAAHPAESGAAAAGVAEARQRGDQPLQRAVGHDEPAVQRDRRAAPATHQSHAQPACAAPRVQHGRRRAGGGERGKRGFPRRW